MIDNTMQTFLHFVSMVLTTSLCLFHRLRFSNRRVYLRQTGQEASVQVHQRGAAGTTHAGRCTGVWSRDAVRSVEVPSEPQSELLSHKHRDTLSHTVTHCHTLVTHCHTLSHTVTHCNTLSHTVTHCHTLSHTVTHCNTLSHTVTHLSHTVTHCHTRSHTVCEALFNLVLIKCQTKTVIIAATRCPLVCNTCVFVCLCVGSTLTIVGEYQKKLGGAEREFLQTSAASFLTPLRNFLEGDWRTISVSLSDATLL